MHCMQDALQTAGKYRQLLVELARLLATARPFFDSVRAANERFNAQRPGDLHLLLQMLTELERTSDGRGLYALERQLQILIPTLASINITAPDAAATGVCSLASGKTEFDRCVVGSLRGLGRCMRAVRTALKPLSRQCRRLVNPAASESQSLFVESLNLQVVSVCLQLLQALITVVVLLVFIICRIVRRKFCRSRTQPATDVEMQPVISDSPRHRPRRSSSCTSPENIIKHTVRAFLFRHYSQ